MSEGSPIQNRNEILELDGALLNLGILHDLQQDKEFEHTYFSDNCSVNLAHSTEDSNVYKFRTRNREEESRDILSHRVYEVTVHADGEEHFAALRVYTEVSPAKHTGNLVADWVELQKTTGMSLPSELDRVNFEKIFTDYCNYLVEQEQGKDG